jgi:hypothetical protein
MACITLHSATTAKTYGTPAWIWSVAVGDALYVRAYNGVKSRWYQASLKQKAGRIIAAGMTKEVAFEPVDGEMKDLIDDAYRVKYRESPYLNPMIGAGASPESAMTHTACQEMHDGKNVDWMEKVTDQEYKSAPQ